MSLDSYNSLVEVFYDLAEKRPEDKLYRYVNNPDSDEPEQRFGSRTRAEVKKRVSAIGKYLQALGVELNTPVAILSNTRAEWLEIDLAILSNGGISVGLYQSLGANDIAYILNDSSAEIVFAENQEQVDKLLSLHEHTIEVPGHEDRPGGKVKFNFKKIITIEETETHPLLVSLAEILSDREPEFEYNRGLTRDSLAALVYTSGTTGPPKGVMQTHGNHLSNLRQAYASGIAREGISIFMFLPLAHAFARLMGYLGFMTPIELIFTAVAAKGKANLDPRIVLKDMRLGSAMVVPIVPRLLEKMESAVRLKAKGRGLSKLLLRICLEQLTAEKHSSSITANWLLRKISNRISQQLFGPNFLYAISGGAKLPIHVSRFFAALDICVLEGYGLTETCVATNVNPPGRNKIGTVGPVLDSDIELKINEQGEICFRGPNITSGYYRRPTATAAAWDSAGFFHTGDLGALDETAYLSIVGRIKELIVTSGGKKIAPQAIEDKLKAVPLISQAVLIGEARPFLIALLTLEQEELQLWARSKELTDLTHAEAKAELRKTLWKEIEGVNSTLASFETIKNFLLLEADFSVENGLLTPTFKVKRRLVEERFTDEIDSLYNATYRE